MKGQLQSSSFANVVVFEVAVVELPVHWHLLAMLPQSHLPDR